MIPTLEELGLNRFSLEQRLAIADALWDSVANELTATDIISENAGDGAALTPVPANQIAELDRRIEKSKANPDAASPWEEVKARILARAKQ